MSVMDKAALLREAAELERRFAAIQEQLAEWEGESKSEPVAAPKRDRKKYTPLAVTKRVQRDEAQRIARAEREAALKARAEKLRARARAV